MYHDIGISDWTCEVDETSEADLWSRLRPIHDDPRAARTRVQKVMTRVAETQRRMVEVARRSVQPG